MEEEKEEVVAVGKMYKLFALWHPRHGEMVEIIMQRESITQAYHGQQIFHVAFDPLDEEKRREDEDEEFVADNFRDLILDDDVDLYDMLENFNSLPSDIITAAQNIKDAEGLNTYVYVYNGWLEVSFGENQEEARRDAFEYMIEKYKALKNGEDEE